MNNNELIQRLDLAYKQYLQILRPYLAQLADQNLLDCCNSWLQRLSSCTEEEKKVRNQYILTMCCQLSKGCLKYPFNKVAPVDSLENLPTDINSSNTTSDVECDCEKSEHSASDSYKQELLKNAILSNAATNYINKKRKGREFEKDSNKSFEISADENTKKDASCCADADLEQCPTDGNNKVVFDCRATNLIMKLREIKKENIQLHKQITALKREMHINGGQSSKDTSFMDNSAEVCLCETFSGTTIRSLKNKLMEMSESRNRLIETIGTLQEKLDRYEEMKKHEIEDIKANHRLDAMNLRTLIREECNNQQKATLDESSSQQGNKPKEQINNSLQEELKLKDKQIDDLNVQLKQKDEEMDKLKKELDLQKERLQAVMEKYLEKQSYNNDSCNEGMKNKAEVLEKQLNKMEKSKIKRTKFYESRLAYLQREKHLSDTTYQLQLIRQRAQITSEMVDENQSEFNAAMEKLEARYKEIVANVQATAIQRRIQDQKSLDAILQTMKEMKNVENPDVSSKNCNPASPLRVQRIREPNKDKLSCFCQGDKNRNVAYENDSVMDGFCLDSEKMVQLFNKIYVPQKDTTDVTK